MNIRLIQILTLAYISLIFILKKSFSIIPIIALAAVILLDYLLKSKLKIKNLLYILAALSSFMPLFWLFVMYLPYAVFGLLLPNRNFIKNYVVGFAFSFIPFMIIYLLSTYFSVPLHLPVVLLIYLLLPALAFFKLKERALESLEINDRDCLLFFIILISTTIIGIGIVDNENLFMSNGTREYARAQYAMEELINNKHIPTYNPRIAQGEATYLFDAPSRAAQYLVENLFFRFLEPILFFNIHSFFILFMSVLALSVLYRAVLNKEPSLSNTLILGLVTVLIGLNFVFLQLLESIKQFTAFPIGYLLISLVIGNPKTLNEFLMVMYLAVVIMPIHSAYGFGTIIFAVSLLILKKWYYMKDRSELKQLKEYVWKNKFLLAVIFIIVILIPIFYVSNGFIYKDFFIGKATPHDKFTIGRIKTLLVGHFSDFYYDDIRILSLRYPDVNRLDDQVAGAFVSVLGVVAIIVLLLGLKLKGIGNFRIYFFSYMSYFLIISSVPFGIMVGGLFRTNKPFLLIMLGAAIVTFIDIFKNKIVKSALIAVLFIGLAQAVPFASANITNIHREKFMSGEIYKSELDFIKHLPIDGRILTYGVFNNAIDFGASQLTGRYFSREEREELLYHIRNIYWKIHGPHSFGDDVFLYNKTGVELSNYLRLGGYKYIFANVCHRAGNFIALSIYPNYSKAIYQNECMAVLAVNKTNYAEKIDLAKNASSDDYVKNDGYKYDTISEFYPPKEEINYAYPPREPEGLSFERMSTTKIKIVGNFNDNEWVIFKERFWPRWKAYINGKKVPVYPDMHEQILIKTIKGKEIILEYAPLGIEKIFGTLSIIGVFGFSILVLILIKKD